MNSAIIAIVAVVAGITSVSLLTREYMTGKEREIECGRDYECHLNDHLHPHYTRNGAIRWRHAHEGADVTGVHDLLISPHVRDH